MSYPQDSAYHHTCHAHYDTLKRDIGTADRIYITRASSCGATLLLTDKY